MATVDPCAARAELERLLEDSRLHLTDRNRAFLRYAAEQYFTGNFKGAKAYAIAIDVFGRPPSFDPGIDPIVRIEAARIRAALDQYYCAYGEPQQVRISLPRGHYIAEFSYMPEEEEPRQRPRVIDALPAPAPAAIPSPQPASNPLWPRRLAVVAAVVLPAGGIVIALETPRASPPPDIALTSKPLVRFTVSTRDPENNEQAESIQEALVTAVTRFGTLRITTGSSDPDVQASSTTSGKFRDFSLDASDYQISLKYKISADQHGIVWAVREAKSGETFASGEEKAPIGSRSISEVDTDLVAALARRFGAGLGLLGNREMHNNTSSATLGNACVLRGDLAIARASIADLADARLCLEATLHANRLDADANATLSRVLVASDEAAGAFDHSAEALALADDAVSAAPTSDRALAARMMALFAVGRPDAAVVVGNETLAANPLNAEILGAFGLRLYLTGSFADGLMLARRAARYPETAPAEAEIVLALEAYRTGDYKAAMLQLDGVVGDDVLGSFARIATLVRAGRRAEAMAAMAEAERVNPHYADLLAKVTRARRIDPGLAAMLERDIDLAAGSKG
jgi:tetratricopeptide (TPR) repeat protein